MTTFSVAYLAKNIKYINKGKEKKHWILNNYKIILMKERNILFKSALNTFYLRLYRYNFKKT